MLSKLRYLSISIFVSLVIIGVSPPLSCAERITSESITIVAVGDVMLSRMVGERIRLIGDPKAPFLETAEILEKADITFCNLESPFYDDDLLDEEWLIFGAEPTTIEGLKYAGFDIVSLANNHFGDQGVAGMLFTFTHLNENRIEYIGAGKNEEKAREPKIIERNGVKFAFLGYNDVKPAIQKGYMATSEKPGVAVLTKDNLMEDIKRAKERAQVVIVSIHWGIEYETSPTERQITFAHLAIDSGASLVLGHHPHVIQPLEEYKDGYIFYSLGNFVFDQMWSEETRKGLIAEIIFEDGQIKKVETMEVVIYDSYQPRPVSPYALSFPRQQVLLELYNNDSVMKRIRTFMGIRNRNTL